MNRPRVLPAIVVLSLLALVMPSLGESARGRILFSSKRGRTLDLYAINPDGTDLVRLTNSRTGEITPAWSPDGTKIACANPELCVINADGSGFTTPNPNKPSTAYPAWAPDGSKIVYAESIDRNIQLILINIDGTGRTQLTEDKSNKLNPIWSPDGTVIYYFAHYKEDALGVKTGTYVINVNGGTPRKLANGRLCDLSPDGAWLAYVEGKYSSAPKTSSSYPARAAYQAYLIKIDGTSQPQLLGIVDGEDTIQWSPDGDRLAYLQNGDLYTIDGNGQGERLRLAEKVGSFSWSPDGTMLVCRGYHGTGAIKKGGLFIVNTISGVTTLLTEDSSAANPIWSPR